MLFPRTSRIIQTGYLRLIAGMGPLVLLSLLIPYQVLIAQYSPRVLENMWQPDGSVNKVVRDGNTIIVGGGFSYIGPDNPYGNAVSQSTGIPNFNFLKPNGVIYSAVSDGLGGWYIGGSFTQIGGQKRLRVAHLLSNGQLSSFGENKGFNDKVSSLALDNNTLYVGGSFNHHGAMLEGNGGAARKNDAAVDLRYPVLSTTQLSERIHCVIPDGQGGWFIGGYFNSIGGVGRKNLARINADGSIHPWNPSSFSREIDPFGGEVYTLALIGNAVYVGGEFRTLGDQSRSNLAAVDTGLGRILPWNPNVNDAVYSMTASGNLIYVCGMFDSISGRERKSVAAIDIYSGVPTNWNPRPNQFVYRIVKSGSNVFISGEFDSLGSVAKDRIAVVDSATGIPAAWNFNLNGQVYDMAASENKIYIGGDFVVTTGQTRLNLCAIDAGNLNLLSWNPNPDDAVTAIAISRDKVYIGGYFSQVGGLNRPYVAAVDTAAGTILPWNLNVERSIWSEDLLYGQYMAKKPVASIASNDSMVYVGGLLKNIGGQGRRCFAALNASTGDTTSLTPNFNNDVTSVFVADSSIYVGGYFTSVNGQTRNRIASLNKFTGGLTAWNPNANNAVNAISVNGNTVYLGGDFTSVGGLTRNRLAAVNKSTGLLTVWNPNANTSVKALLIHGNLVYIGGSFTNVGGLTRNFLAAVDTILGSVNSWNPNADDQVYALSGNGNVIYAGGRFKNIGGQERNSLAALDAANGSATSWNAITNTFGVVYAISPGGGNVYIGGSYSSLGGVKRRYLASYNAINGNVSSWNPNLNGSVNDLAVFGNTIYVGGSFSTVGGQVRNHIAAIDRTTAIATSWNPNSNGSVFCIQVQGNKVYTGGRFTQIGGQQRSNLAAIDALTGSATSWSPNPNSDVNTIEVANDQVYVGGIFTSIGGQARNSLASIDTIIGNALPWNPNSNNGVYTIKKMGNQIYAGGYFTQINGQSRNYLAAINATTGVVSTWNPNPNCYVFALLSKDSNLYMGGCFDRIGGLPRYAAAKANLYSGLITSWSPPSKSWVYGIASFGDTVFTGNDYSPQSLIAYLDTFNTAPSVSWYLDADNDGWYIQTQQSQNTPGDGWTSELPSGGAGDCDDNNPLVSTLPAPAGGITGPLSLPSNSLNVDYSITPIEGATSYSWSLPAGWSVTAGANTHYITVNSSSSGGILRVQGVNSCGVGTAVSLNVNITPCTAPPAQPGTISGTTAVCQGAAYTYSIAPVNLTTSYTWTVPSGWTIQSGQGTTSIQVLIGSSGNSISVMAVNACGQSVSRSLSITRTSLPAAAGVITGPASPSPGSSQTYTVPSIVRAVGYNWILPAGWSVTAGTNTRTITVTVGTGSGNVSVAGTNSCGSGASSSLAVSVPCNAITWYLDADNDGRYVSTQSSCASPGAGWTSTLPSGGMGDCNDGNAAVYTTFSFYADLDGDGFGAGSLITGVCAANANTPPTGYSLNTTDCDDSNGTIHNVPSAASSISGAASVASGATGLVYSVAVISQSSSYVWSVPAGWTITSGSGTNSITISAGSSGGNISVYGTNSCGNGTSSGLSVTVTSSCTAPAQPGTISGTAAVCQGTVYTYSIASVNGATSYSWTVPASWTIQSGQGTTSIQVLVGNAGTSISVRAINACGQSTSRSLSVTRTNIPSAAGAITGASTPTQGNSEVYSVAAITGATGYNWTFPMGWTVTAGSNTRSITVTVGSNSGNITVAGTNSCGNGTISTLTVTVPCTPVTWYFDADNDGWYVNTQSSCVSPGAGWTSTLPAGGSGDCNDNNASLFATFGFYTDSDGDGFGTGSLVSGICAVNANTPPSGYSVNNTDCNDNNSLIWQSNSLFVDNDNDGYDAGTSVICYGATIPSGYRATSLGTDCNDNHAGINPTITEICGNGIDENCSGIADEGCALIAGPDTICEKASANYTVSGLSGATAFTWSASPSTGVTISGTSQTTKTIKITGSGNFTISVLPNNGQPAITKTIFVRVLPTAGTISGANPVCLGGPGAYTVTGMLNATSYSWSAPAGASVLNSSANTANYQFGSAVSYTISVRGSNQGCLASAARTLTVTTALPPSGGSITGSTTACQGVAGTYSVTGMANTTTATVYTWTATNGATMTGTGTSRTITFPNTGSSTITVQTANGGCTGATLTMNIMINSAPTATYMLSGSTTSCEGQVRAYTTTATSGVTYTWSVNPVSGGIVSGGQGTSSASVTFNGTYASASNNVTVTMVPSVGSCARTASTRMVTVSKYPVNGTLSTTPDTACTGQSVICTAGATNASTYTWSISGAASSGSGSSSTRTITVGTSIVTVRVTPKNGSCSGSQLSKTVQYQTLGCAKEGQAEYIGEQENKEVSVSLFPSPTRDRVILRVNGMKADEHFVVQWYDMTGRKVRETSDVFTGSGTEVELNAMGLPQGIYVLQLESAVNKFIERLSVE